MEIMDSLETVPDNPEGLNELGSKLQRRFQLTGSIDYLSAAIEARQEAVNSTPKDHPRRAVYLHNLSNALQTRFEQTGLREDIDAAVAASKEALKSGKD